MEERLSRREYEDLAKNRLFDLYLGQWIKQFGIKDVVFREYEFYVYGLPFRLDIIKSKVFEYETTSSHSTTCAKCKTRLFGHD